MLIIESRYNGPPGSANGGYAAGRFAAVAGLAEPTEPAGATVQVTLRRPPPLAVPMTVVPAGEGNPGATLLDPDGALVAEAAAVPVQPAAVPSVSRADAVGVSAGYPGFTDHPFPTCYVCGPQHPDGLRIFPGVLPDGRTAAPFTAPARLGPETVWAALDCPGGWAVISPGRAYVLGRIAAVIHALPAAGDECVVVGQHSASHGRRAEVRTCLYGPDGALLAHAWATWVAIAGPGGADQR